MYLPCLPFPRSCCPAVPPAWARFNSDFGVAVAVADRYCRFCRQNRPAGPRALNFAQFLAALIVPHVTAHAALWGAGTLTHPVDVTPCVIPPCGFSSRTPAGRGKPRCATEADIERTLWLKYASNKVNPSGPSPLLLFGFVVPPAFCGPGGVHCISHRNVLNVGWQKHS